MIQAHIFAVQQLIELQSIGFDLHIIGAGGVDPVAALTWDVADIPLDGPAAPAGKPIAAPPEPAPRDNTGRIVAFAGTGALALAALAVAFAAYRRKDPTT